MAKKKKEATGARPANEADAKVQFVVERLQINSWGGVELVNVVLAPAPGNDIFGGNTLARIEITRLEPAKANEFEIGDPVNMQLAVVAP